MAISSKARPMAMLVKCLISAVVLLAVYYFSYWAVFGQILSDGMRWLVDPASLLLSAAAAFWAWRKAGIAGGIISTAFLWALVVGALGFCVGFFGPLIFTSEANQGPLLGIFVTGPLGFLVGGISGLIYAIVRARASA